MDRTSFVARNQSNIPLPAPMPAAAIRRLPTVKGIAGIGDTPAPTPATTLTQRLPSIVNPVAATPSAACDPFTAWVAANPLFAVGGLALVAYFTIFHKGKK